MTKVTRLTLDTGAGLERRRLNLRESPDVESSPLETVGDELRAARERKGEDLAQIAAILKIRRAHLGAIEGSDFDALPGRTYMIGFVRTYANYLGLDGKQCVERIKAEIAGRIENRENNAHMNVPEERKLPQGWFLLAAALVIAVAYGGYYLVTINRSAPPLTQAVPARLQAAVEPPPAAPAPAPAVDQGAAAATSPPAPESQAAPAPLPEGQRLGLQNTASRITLRAHRAQRIDITGPDRRSFLARVLQPGDTYRVPNFTGIVLKASDAGAIEILVDGKSVGYAGHDGVAVESLSLNVQDFLNRQGQAG